MLIPECRVIHNLKFLVPKTNLQNLIYINNYFSKIIVSLFYFIISLYILLLINTLS